MIQIGAYSIVRADIRDAGFISPRLCDVQEWEASIEGGIANLGFCIGASEDAWTFWRDQRAQMILGVVTEGNAMPTTWLIGTDKAQEDAQWLLQDCREFIEAFFKRWPQTECFCDERNEAHHRWVRWLGYREHQRLRLGPQDRMFINFRKGL